MCGGAHTHGYSSTDQHTNANRDGYTDTHSNGHPGAHCNTRSNTHSNAASNANPRSERRDRDAHTCAKAHPNADAELGQDGARSSLQRHRRTRLGEQHELAER